MVKINMKPIVTLTAAIGIIAALPNLSTKAQTYNPTLVEKLEQQEYEVERKFGDNIYHSIADNKYQTTNHAPGTLVAIFKRGTSANSLGYFRELFEKPGNRYVYAFMDDRVLTDENPYIVPSKYEYRRYDTVYANDFSKFHIRYSHFIEKPAKNNNYYLDAHKQNDEGFYNKEIRFYEGVNYMLLPKDDLTQVLETYTPAVMKNIQGKSIIIPKVVNTYKEPIARLYAKSRIPLLKKEANGTYTAVKMLDKGGFYRVYGVEGNLYDVGGGYYVPRNDNLMSHYIGRVKIESNTPLYNKDGKVHRQLKAGEYIRVYDYKDNKYDVGGGYYILGSKSTKYMVGVLKANKNIPIYNESGKKVGSVNKGQRLDIIKLIGDKAYINNSTYIKHDRVNTTYSKS